VSPAESHHLAKVLTAQTGQIWEPSYSAICGIGSEIIAVCREDHYKGIISFDGNFPYRWDVEACAIFDTTYKGHLWAERLARDAVIAIHCHKERSKARRAFRDMWSAGPKGPLGESWWDLSFRWLAEMHGTPFSDLASFKWERKEASTMYPQRYLWKLTTDKATWLSNPIVGSYCRPDEALRAAIKESPKYLPWIRSLGKDGSLSPLGT